MGLRGLVGDRARDGACACFAARTRGVLRECGGGRGQAGGLIGACLGEIELG